jgi:hypothetical protein
MLSQRRISNILERENFMRAAAVICRNHFSPRESQPRSVLRTLGFLAVIGFLAVVLAGPILGVIFGLLSAFFALFLVILSVGVAVIAVLLPLAIIGFFIWAPIRIFFLHRRPAWDEIRENGRTLVFSLFWITRWSLVTTWRLADRAQSQVCHVWQATWHKASRHAWFVSGILLELASGAIVGGTLGWITGSQEHENIFAIAVGAIAGGVLGFMIGLSRSPRFSEEPVHLEYSEMV